MNTLFNINPAIKILVQIDREYIRI